MFLLSSAIVLHLIDSMAIVLSQAYQLARARLAFAASPIVRLLVQRDQAVSEVDLLRRELVLCAHFGAPIHGGTHKLRTRPARPPRATFSRRQVLAQMPKNGLDNRLGTYSGRAGRQYNPQQRLGGVPNLERQASTSSGPKFSGTKLFKEAM